MIRAIVLPGLDGSADLRAEFVAALAPEFDAQVLAYPCDAVRDYAAMTDWVHARLPTQEPYALIAESYGGPIAIALAARRPAGLAGVVLVGSFARTPRPSLAWLRFLIRALPLRPGRHFDPTTLIAPLMMGRWSTPLWRRRLRDSMAAVPGRVLQARLHSAACVDVLDAIADIDCPLLYLQATHDRVVPGDAWTYVRARARHAACIGIEGPHMLLQARPDACAAAIKR